LKLLSTLPFLLFALACVHHRSQKEIAIQGNIKDFPDGKLFLYKNFNARLPYDSTTIKNGNFKFTLKEDPSFYPFETFITYYNDSIPGFIHEHEDFLGGYKNPYYNNYVMSSFYVDRGKTIISGQKSEHAVLTIAGTKQNEAFYKIGPSAFAIIRGLTGTKREAKLALYENTIKKYPWSFYLLNRLWYSREEYTEQELKGLLSAFNEEVSRSAVFKDFTSFFELKTSSGYLSNISLESADGGKQSIFDPKAKINLVVFWYSGCAPCRKEIPDLKELYSKFKDKGLSICSISMDNNLKRWKAAMAKERMPWKQLIINDSINKTIDLEYNIKLIPVSFFTDAKGKLIQRSGGQGDKIEYDRLLTKLLTQ